MKPSLHPLLPALAALLIPFSSLAETEEINGITWSYSLSNGEATITGANPATGDLVCPATVGEDYPVVAVGDRAFRECSGITSFVIPSGVRTIGNSGVFLGCSSLTSVTIPNTVTRIGWMAFYGCFALKTLFIPDSVIEFYLGDSVFSYSGLETLSLPVRFMGSSLGIPDSCAVSYRFRLQLDANGGMGDPVETNYVYSEEDAQNRLPACSFLNGSLMFAGWAATPDGSVKWADQIPLNDDIASFAKSGDGTATLYARWSSGTYTIRFDPNGGTGTMDDAGAWIDVPCELPTASFSREGMIFTGWSLDPGTLVDYADRMIVSNLAAAGSSVTLHAVWSDATHGLAIGYYSDWWYQHTWQYGWGPEWRASGTAAADFFLARTPLVATNTFSFGPGLESGFADSGLSYAQCVSGGLTPVDFESCNFHGDYANSSQNRFSCYLVGKIEIPSTGVYSFASCADDMIAVFIDGTNVCESLWDGIGTGSIDLVAGMHDIAVCFAEQDGGQGFSVQWKRPGDASFAQIPQCYLSHDEGTVPLSFNANGGTGAMASVESDRNFGVRIPANTFTRIGHSFAGWATTANGEVAYVDESNVRPGVAELFAKWTLNSYTVGFDSDGGTEVESITQVFGSAITSPASPTRTGYGFVGWEPEIPATMPPSNLTCRAQWTPNHYTIRFNANGGTGNMADEAAIYDEPSVLPQNAFTRANRFFAGWATAADGAVVYTNGSTVVNLTSVAGGVGTLYAVWADARIVFDKNGGEGEMEPFYLFNGAEQTLPQCAFINTNGFFLGWALSADGEATLLNGDSTADLAFAQGETITLYAVWHEGVGGKYLVLDLNAGSAAESYSVSCLVAAPNGGFNTDEYKTTKLVLRRIEPGSFIMGGGSDESHGVTLTMPFYCGVFEVTQKQYELVTGSNPSYYRGDKRPIEQVSWNTIRGDSGTYNWPSSANVNPNSFMGRLRARTGLDFDLPTEAQWEYVCRAGTTTDYNNGTNYGGDFSNDPNLNLLGRYRYNRSDGKGGHTDAHTVVGSYQPNAWDLYDMHGNVWEWCLDWHGMLEYGADPKSPSSGSGRVHCGGGWGNPAYYCTSSYVHDSDPSISYNDVGFRLVLPSDVFSTYAVRFDANGGEGSMPKQIYASGDDVEIPGGAFSREGYTLVGWATEPDGVVSVPADGTLEGGLESAPGETVTLYARWSLGTYAVHFDANGGAGEMADQSLGLGVPEAISSNRFSKVGYTHTGWTLDGGDGTVIADKAVVTNLAEAVGATATLKAVWTPNQYTIRFAANGGTGTMADETATYDEERVLPRNEFTRENLTFVGWATATDGAVVYTNGATVVNLTAAVNGNFTLYAVWGCLVSFDADGGTVSTESKTIVFEAAYGALPVPVRSGYTFAGWTLNGAEITAGSKCSTASNHTLVATWSPNEYTVAFDAAGGSVKPSSKTVTFDAAYGELPMPSRAGYSFAGWTLGGNAVNAGTIVATPDNHTLVATWTPNEYKVFFDAADGEWEGDVPTIIVTFGSAYGELPVPIRTGYSYVWSLDGSPVGSETTVATASDHTLVALWTPNEYTVQFDATIGTVSPSSKTVTFDSAYGGLPVPVNAEHVFIAWLLDGLPATSEMVVQTAFDHTLTASWSDWMIRFDANGGAGTMVNQPLWLDQPATTISKNSFTRNGFFFLGWALTPDGEAVLLDGDSTAGIEAEAGETVTLYAVWHEGSVAKDAYALRFDANGGVFSPPNGLQVSYYDISSSGYSTWTQSEAAMTNYFVSRAPTITTNTLDWGESLQSGFQNDTGLTTKFAEFPGLWLDVVSTNRYHEQYASVSEETFAMLLTGSLFVDAAGSYSFGAACDDEIVLFIDGTRVCAVNGFGAPSKGSIALSAGSHRIAIAAYENGGSQGMFVAWKKPGDTAYSPIPQSVLFRKPEIAETTVLPKRVYACGDTVDLPDGRVRRTGYSLAGWATTPNGAVAYPATETLANGVAASNGETVDLYAVWTANEYTATFDADGGEIAPIPADGLDLRYYDIPDEDYWTWSESETALTNYFASRIATIETNTLDFGDSLDPGIAGVASSSVSSLLSWGMNGLRFEANGTTNRFHGKYAQKDQENIAVYVFGEIGIEEPGAYSFACIADDYEAIFIDGQRVCCSQWDSVGSGSISLSAGFHRFSMGFSEGGGGHGFAVQWKKPGGTAWSPLPQSVLWSSQRSRIPDSKAATFDAAYGELPTVSRTGYTFAEWTIDGVGITAETICTQPSNHVIVAAWTPNGYEVSFDPTGGTVSPTAKVVTFDAAYGELPTPACEGYVFLDWRLDGAAVDAATIVQTAEDHTLSARWGVAVGNGVWEEMIADEPIVLGAPGIAPTGAVEIPAEINGRPVVGIAADAFAGNTAITAITVPESVTNIAAGAFAGCSGLETLYLPLRFGVDADDLSIPSTCAVVYRGTLSVSSAHGNPVPGVGTTNLELAGSTSLACSVDGVEDSGDGVRYVCAGWTGTGMTPASGTGTNATVALTENATLTWHWTTNVWAECIVTGDATSAGLAAWLEKDGAGAVVSFAPDGEPFSVALSGDTDGVVLDTDACTVSIPADRPRSVGVSVCFHRIDNAVETGAAAAWTSGADADGGWHVAADATVADGYSLRSDEITAGQTAAVQVSLPLAGTLSFDWRVSSAVRRHFACFYVDGARQDRISGETDWATVALDLGDGPHTIRWTYEKSSAAASGDDAAFLDNVRWDPLTLPEALDETNVIWTTEGGADWTPQVSVSADGRSAARSGALVGEETSRLVAVVDGSGTLAWKWKTDVEDIAGVDVYLDGTMLDEPYLMDEPDWTDASLAIEGDGPHRVEFRFWNGGTEATISDCAYIDCASWDPAFVRVEGVAVPTDWIRANAAEILAEADGDVFAAARATASNGVDKVWQCYVAGLDPSSPTDRLLATISIDGNGEPVVGWAPDLEDARDYAVDGKASLTNEWGVWNGDSRFFRVRVAMPGGFGSYTISFDSAGGSVVDPIAADYGAPVAAPDAPTKAGYSFAGWSPPLPATMPAHNLSLRALWSANRYTITFVGAGGGAVDPIEADYGAPVFAPEAPTREGYAFAGWTPAFPATMPLGGAALTAQWTANRYSVHFEPGEGSGTMGDQPFYFDVTQSLSRCTFANGGHSFAGWATNANGDVVYADGALVENLATENGAVVTLWAVWTESLPGLAIRYYDIGTPNNSVWSQSEFSAIGDFASRTPTVETNTLDWGESLDAGFTTLPNSSQQSAWRSTGLAIPGDQCLLHGKYAIESENHFAALLTGNLWVEEQGSYEFASVADDLVILFIDGERILTNDQSWDVVATGNAELAAGTHSITVVFYENYNAQGLSVQWRKPGDSSYAPIPQSVLSHWAGTDTLAFDANGGEGVMESIEVDRNFGAKLPICTFAKADMQFAGWATNQACEAVYGNGAYVPPGIATLWAVWSFNPLYLVVDVSAGSGDTAIYPVSGLSDVPAGGWTDEYKTTKIVLRRVDAGSFTMGSPDDEIGRSPNEDRHGVTITKPFYIGVFQVTQKQWECVMGDNPSAYTGDKRPVEHVSYYDIRGGSLGANWPASSAVDATSFLGRLRARATGHAWELPTEAQWEYACRAGTDTALNSGKNLTRSDEDSNMDEVGRYYYNRYDGKGGYSERHTAVGSYLPNDWGLYDMHGNVLEWCADRYQEHLGTASAVDPVGPDSGSYCVRRSGGSANGADCQRSAHRDGLSAPSMNIDFNTGFRLAASASE